mgnify:CR=1 FL=1
MKKKKKKKKKEREEEVKKGQRRNGHFALAMSEESPKKYRVGPQPAINQVALDEGMEGSCKRRGKEDRGNSSSNSRDQQQRPAGRDEEREKEKPFQVEPLTMEKRSFETLAARVRGSIFSYLSPTNSWLTVMIHG